jgi:PiT family inorganic phosphate transporter
MSAFILLAVLLLAYSNGANDNFKGVATLFGSGTTTYRTALGLATVSTFAGSMLALLLAHGLVDTFKGKGLVPDAVTREPAFLVAVSLGAGLTVLIATRMGLPISTTHALTGALVGAGLLATGGQIHFAALLSTFVVPLLGGPLLAMLSTLVLYPLLRAGRRAVGIRSESCLCMGDVYEPVRMQPDGSVALARTGVAVQTGTTAECVQRYQGRMFGLEAAAVLDALHYVSAGAVGFARGLNDTPKIVALLIAAAVLPPNAGLALIAIVIGLGGILNARRVAETMSRKITRMSPSQGFTANVVTSLLVTVASRVGLPASTTHVSVGALFGIGTVNGTARKGMISTILLAWVTTLPLGAVLAGTVYWMMRGVA